MSHKILWNTSKFVEERKGKKYENEGFFFILGGALVFALSVLLIAYRLVMSNVATFTTKDLIVMPLSAFATTYLMALVVAYFLKEIVDVAYAKFNYERAVAVTGYTFFLLATGFALSVIIALLPGQMSLLLMSVVIPLFLIKAYSLFLRALALYAKMNMVESFVISFILTTALMAGMVLSNYLYLIMHFDMNKLLI